MPNSCSFLTMISSIVFETSGCGFDVLVVCVSLFTINDPSTLFTFFFIVLMSGLSMRKSCFARLGKNPLMMQSTSSTSDNLFLIFSAKWILFSMYAVEASPAPCFLFWNVIQLLPRFSGVSNSSKNSDFTRFHSLISWRCFLLFLNHSSPSFSRLTQNIWTICFSLSPPIWAICSKRLTNSRGS